MNDLERLLAQDVRRLIDRLAIPEGAVDQIRSSMPTLATRTDDLEERLAAARATLLDDYACWRQTLLDAESIWGARGVADGGRERARSRADASRGVETMMCSPVGSVLRGAALMSVMVAPASALAQDRTWEWHWSTHPMMFMWGAGGILMMLMMLLFWGVVIAGFVLGLRWLVTQGRPTAPRDEALEILRQRYARGEIDRQEFETRKRDLGV
jgi:putative membrane protein